MTSMSTEGGERFGHLNLMTDTVISNLETSDLRAILRNLITASSANATLFVEATRRRLDSRPATGPDDDLFSIKSNTIEPTPSLTRLMARARVEYGCGKGFESLKIFKMIVKSLTEQIADPGREGVRSKLSDQAEESVSFLDADICQAVQACTEVLLVRKESADPSFLPEARWKVLDLYNEIMWYEKQVFGASFEMAQLSLISLERDLTVIMFKR